MQTDKIKIGDKLHFKGNSIIPPLDGEVTAIWYKTDEEDHDAVTIKPDTLPEDWPYKEYDVFCPWVEEVEEVEAS